MRDALGVGGKTRMSCKGCITEHVVRKLTPLAIVLNRNDQVCWSRVENAPYGATVGCAIPMFFGAAPR